MFSLSAGLAQRTLNNNNNNKSATSAVSSANNSWFIPYMTAFNDDAFANFYMCHIENSIVDSEPAFKPTTYCRYTDDIFIITDDIDDLLKLKQSFEETYILTFTYEIGINHHINFLDVLVDDTQPNILFCITKTH